MNRTTRTAGAVGLVAASLTAVVATAAPASASVGISGQVMCVDQRSVVGLWVQAANGGSGWATLTNVNGYTKNYRYTLPRGGSYSVHVGCGGTSQSWATSNKSPYVSGSYNSFTCYDTTAARAAYLLCQRT